jgi:hypothetical protein
MCATQAKPSLRPPINMGALTGRCNRLHAHSYSATACNDGLHSEHTKGLDQRTQAFVKHHQKFPLQAIRHHHNLASRAQR